MSDPSSDDNTSVRVALRIRPQLAREKIDMCQVCTSVTPGEPQVTLGKDKPFTYDYVFDRDSTQDQVYDTCARPLIEGCLEGYNATIFAYGQTGSGKTFSMGTGLDVACDPEQIGIIPRAVDHLFKGIEERKQKAAELNLPPPDFKVNAQFMELYNEEILDLLDSTRDPAESRRGKSHIKIHEDASGGIYTVGVTTRTTTSLDDTLQCLKMGALSRTTASTNMNSQSSRSHAIFTLHIKQLRVVPNVTNSNEVEEGKEADTTETEFETLTAKFHFVDLAGSERLKRTGATGDRAKEGISINCGLLALGNVISALGDKAKKGSHVPYRDSKLTRLLQDSLGGNSRTVMIACVSPSDRDFMETLNTMKYANRARNITNKVVVNQDKASRQIAALREEIRALQAELQEYQSGKRMVDADGVETINDMFHENTMLQTENNNLRTRIKALQETIDSLTARNVSVLAERANLALSNISGEEGSDEISSLINGYLKEIEELRTKLMESEAMCETLRRQGLRTPASRAAMSPLHQNTFQAVPMTSGGSLSRNLELPTSPDNNVNALLELAKKDVKKMRKKVRSRNTSRSEQASDDEKTEEKEDAEKNGVADDVEHEESQEKDSETEEGDQNKENCEEETVMNGDGGDQDEDGDDDDGDGDEDDDEESSTSSDSEDLESDNIHEDLAELTCEISIKQKLIEELELSQRRLQSLKIQYEEKLSQLQSKIKQTEEERDKVLSSLGNRETTNDKAKKIREEYEKKLREMQNEMKKLNAAKKEHSKLVKNQSQYDRQMKQLQRELTEMKKTKAEMTNSLVKLMNQMKAEAEKNKNFEARKNKEIAQLRKEHRKKEAAIKQLEQQKQQKEMVLRKKFEEVENLKKKQKPMSAKAAGRVANYSARPRYLQQPMKKKKDFNPKDAKHKWDILEKHVSSTVTKRQTLYHMEKDMNIWLKRREDLGKKIEKVTKRREKLLDDDKESEALEMEEVLIGLKAEIDLTQDYIMDCQKNIMQMEESTKDEKDFSQLIDKCTHEEALYLLEHFLGLAINKGLLAAQKETETRELGAKLHSSEMNSTLTQQLLEHVIADRVDDLEIYGIFPGEKEDSESSDTSNIDSPVDRILMEDQILSSTPKPWQPGEKTGRRDKARRRTATTEDLLYPDSGGPPRLSNGGSALPVLPAVEEDTEGKQAGDSLVMPPPKPSMIAKPTALVPSFQKWLRTYLLRMTKGEEPTDDGIGNLPRSSTGPATSGRRSGDGLPSAQPASRPVPEPSPSLRRKAMMNSTSRQNSVESADLTPPSSPSASRRSVNRGENVFSRLTSNTQPSSPDPKRGSIQPYGGSIRQTSGRPSPLECVYTASGHTKAILSLFATDDVLFSSSKDRTVKVWDLATGQDIVTLRDHPNNVVCVRYSEYTRLVFSVCNSVIKVWDIRDKTQNCIKTLSSSGLTSQGSTSSTGTVGRQVAVPQGEQIVNDIVLNRYGTVLYSAAGNLVRLWDLRRFNAVGKFSGGHQAPVMVLAIDETEEGESATVVTGSKDHYIKVFEVPENSVGVLTPKLNLEPPHYDGIQSLALYGDCLFSGSRDMCIKKWDLTENSLKQSMNNAHKDWVCAMAFTPGKNGLLSGCRAGFLKLWNIEDCHQMAEIKAHSSPINAITTNSSTIFTASNDTQIRIWQMKTGYEEAQDEPAVEGNLGRWSDMTEV
ncbi:kinesin-like protein KIF21A isoform X2 [Lingula anatina]|uniref:Kinesin-like protein KIF21A isoform X2 n=1 Tax=Lingula anatina TaxID=7574 RepID=A0A1S3IEB6_LINAN|nr:kinesin-like protein KIF21A isoform X2 [Lingula anatina]|eukprot:XP_013396201.1 kinesin-like protein KIF21A isoform X2 [Lingula anatina]